MQSSAFVLLLPSPEMKTHRFKLQQNVAAIVAGFFITTLGCLVQASPGVAQIDAVTFAVQPKRVYVPLEEAAMRLRWRIRRDEKRGEIVLRRTRISAQSIRHFVDGTELVSVADLESAGAGVERNSGAGMIIIGNRWRRFKAVIGAKRVEINLAKQQLTAWQGERVVLQTRVSSGRGGRTPTGKFRAGPYKARRHYSSLYDNAPMPWSVQVHGHVFIHGFTSVPNYPASHGCIRVPLTGRNPAKFFYEWVNRGTPIRVVRK